MRLWQQAGRLQRVSVKIQFPSYLFLEDAKPVVEDKYVRTYWMPLTLLRKKKKKPSDDGKAGMLDILVGWTTEEDNAIIAARARYGGNWDLIADIVSSLPRPIKKIRTKKQCYERWRVALQSKEDGKAINPTPPSTPISSEGTAPASPPAGVQFAILDIIKKTMQKKKPIPGRVGTHTVSETTVPTHPSHSQVAVSAGFTTTKTPRTPLEIISAKAQRMATKEPQNPPLGTGAIVSIESKTPLNSFRNSHKTWRQSCLH
jgi:hypothetical protein